MLASTCATIVIVWRCVTSAYGFSLRSSASGESIADADDRNGVFLRSMENRSSDKCVHPEGVTCICVHPKYPCYRWNQKKGKCTCSGIMDAGTCEKIGGSMCERPKSCVPNCKTCKDVSTCQECEAGFQGIGGNCTNKSEIFAKVKHARKGNLVMLGSDDLFGALEAGYKGQARRVDAIDIALRSFHQLYKDVFDFVVVFPGRKLEGRVSYGENFHLDAEPRGDSPSKFRSVVTMQLYGPRTSAIPLLHELEHEWGIFRDVEKLTPTRLRTAGPHWGMSAMDRMGMLGGFPRSAVTCSSGVLGESSCTQPLKWDFSKGSMKTSNDKIGGYSKFDLLIMGLMKPEEMEGEKLVFCENPDKRGGRGVTDVRCGKIHAITPVQLEESLEKKEKRLKVGDHLRVAIVTVLSSEDFAREEETDSFGPESGLGWLDKYVGGEPELFEKYTLGRATMSIGAVEADEIGHTEAQADEDLEDNTEEQSDGASEDTPESDGALDGAAEVVQDAVDGVKSIVDQITGLAISTAAPFNSAFLAPRANVSSGNSNNTRSSNT
eukprot:TRINITY_DN61531_c0_g1_i1.p1 TRINITY_DN61531_c0_g1~~TRINITY_DN61531_c0_g1_i1.p1  ORF type:complete len:549 (+),score=87.40 TRINITY_DN61531_c0_g1_i1:46-1692(+)